MDEQLEFLRLIAAHLHAAGIPYMVTGSLARAVRAVPRMTRGIDVVVDVWPADAQRVTGLFAGDCVVDGGAVPDAIARRGMFNVIHAEWIVKADVIVRQDVQQLIAAVKDLDWGYLHTWALELGAKDALERIGGWRPR